MGHLEDYAKEEKISVEELSIRILRGICFPLHYEMTLSGQPFSLDAFAAKVQRLDLLAEIDLDAYQERITWALIDNPSRKVPFVLAYQIYGRVWALQAMARMALKQEGAS